MEVTTYLHKIKTFWDQLVLFIQKKFIKKTSLSQKRELNYSSFKWGFLIFIVLFVGYVLLMPDEVKLEFTQKTKEEGTSNSQDTASNDYGVKSKTQTAPSIWSNSNSRYPNSGGGGGRSSQVNYNTPMVIGNGQNAKNLFRAGIRIPLRITDQFIVSQDPVPILAESILDSQTESGIRIPAGTRFYGEASFQKGSDRAQITFKQISLPGGEIKPISAIAIDKDGQNGLIGKVSADGLKNTTGQVITTFVGGLAAGSIKTDAFGRSIGGIENGLLSAVAETAKSRAQNYGEKLKAEREWITVSSGTELDALLKDNLNLNEGGQL